MVYIYHGILLSNKWNELLIHATTWVNIQGINTKLLLMIIIMIIIRPSQKVTCCSICIAFLVSQNFRNKGRISGYQKLGKFAFGARGGAGMVTKGHT